MFQVLLLVLIAITAFSLASTVAMIRRNGGISGRHFRLTNRLPRWAAAADSAAATASSSGLLPAGPGLGAFGLLWDGCPVAAAGGAPPSASAAGPSLHLNFSAGVTM